MAILSPAVTGQSVTLLVMLHLARGQPDRIDRLRRDLLALPQVTRIYHVTGNADFVLTVQCASMEAYAAFSEAHFYSDDIKGFDTTVVLRTFESEADSPD